MRAARGGGQEGHRPAISSTLHPFQGPSSWICQRPPWREWPTSCWMGLSTRSRSGLRPGTCCSGSYCCSTGGPACQHLASPAKGPTSPAHLPRALPGGPGGPSPTRRGPTFLPPCLLPLTPLEGRPCLHVQMWGLLSSGGQVLKSLPSIHPGPTWSFQAGTTCLHPQHPSKGGWLSLCPRVPLVWSLGSPA